MSRIVIAGGGVGGLTTALLLARAGHRVTVFEKDRALPPARPHEAFVEWDRPGVPQWRLIHTLLPRLRLLLAEHLPDVVEASYAAGARDADPAAVLLPESRIPEDADLRALLCRRAVFEWVLRDRCAAQADLDIQSGCAVRTLIGAAGDVPRITGVRLADGRTVDADLVVDATGRTSALERWLMPLGGRPAAWVSAPVGLIYFSRFYERAEDGEWPPRFRVDTGYSRIAAGPADGRVFSISFFADASERGFRALRDDATFERAVAAFAGLRPWREATTPLASVHAMGDFQNRVRDVLVDGRPTALGILPVGDAVCHTDPFLGRGLTAALMHAVALSEALAAEPGAGEGLAHEFADRVMSEARAIHADAASGSAETIANWRAGRPAGPRARAFIAMRRASQEDPDLWRILVRHQLYLSTPTGLFDDPGLMERVDRLVPADPTPVGPDRAEFLDLLRAPHGHPSS
ncbi:MAG: FAD-dependent oxidoreductase [Candidatus Limnocylindrales bacterium]